MLISCKCLNFIATIGNNRTNKNDEISEALMQIFLQKYPRNFVFFLPCMEFFKQSLGPLSDLIINALSQRDLIYSLTLDVPTLSTQTQSWQLNICVNCNTTLSAKRLYVESNEQQQYLINSSLLKRNDELTHRRTDQSFSEAFGVLIMDHPALTTPNAPPPLNSFVVGSAAMNSNPLAALAESKQHRIRQLQQNLQQRLKHEIAETNDRIQRYTEQQFALLKSFREKSEQEYELLARLIQQVPEQQTGTGEWWLDREPPALEVNLNAAPINYASTRRRHTISSKRDLKSPSTPITPTVISTAAPAFSQSNTDPATISTTSAIEGNTQDKNSGSSAATTAGTNSNILTATSTVATRKLSNFDTPPATPEATPMSISNSPNFRQQQQQQPPIPPQSFGSNNVRLLTSQISFQQQFPTPTAETSDDCIFELEGVENVNTALPSAFNPAAAIISLQQQQVQRNLRGQQQEQQRDPNHHYMSDLDESDADAEEAEDALDMNSSLPIPTASRYRINNNNNNMSSAHLMNFAKSLPIEIAHSPLTERGATAHAVAYNVNLDGDEMDNTVDIAASIKALAKSVHGEAVFGDLPRPRLRSQI